MNRQPIEKKSSRADVLDVHSIFHTIQGEGPFCGTPAVFIRLAGCNLQCPACDTDYTSTRKKMPLADILATTKTFAARGLVVITGGEPFRQEIEKLLLLLTKHDYYVQIETNGTLAPPPGDYNTVTDRRKGLYIVCSPKAGKVNALIEGLACCYKYVLAADSLHADGLPLRALKHPAAPFVARPPKNWKLPIYVQPMDAKDEETNRQNLQAAVTSCMENGYILQLQIHKIINME